MAITDNVVLMCASQFSYVISVFFCAAVQALKIEMETKTELLRKSSL